jgi:hypothetical protein
VHTPEKPIDLLGQRPRTSRPNVGHALPFRNIHESDTIA